MAMRAGAGLLSPPRRVLRGLEHMEYMTPVAERFARRITGTALPQTTLPNFEGGFSDRSMGLRNALVGAGISALGTAAEYYRPKWFTNWRSAPYRTTDKVERSLPIIDPMIPAGSLGGQFAAMKVPEKIETKSGLMILEANTTAITRDIDLPFHLNPDGNAIISELLKFTVVWDDWHGRADDSKDGGMGFLAYINVDGSIKRMDSDECFCHMTKRYFADATTATTALFDQISTYDCTDGNGNGLLNSSGKLRLLFEKDNYLGTQKQLRYTIYYKVKLIDTSVFVELRSHQKTLTN